MQRYLNLLVYLIVLVSSKYCLVRTDQDQDFCPVPETTMLRSQFILFGDSLTQKSFDEGGWGGRLANEYQRKVRKGSRQAVHRQQQASMVLSCSQMLLLVKKV